MHTYVNSGTEEGFDHGKTHAYASKQVVLTLANVKRTIPDLVTGS